MNEHPRGLAVAEIAPPPSKIVANSPTLSSRLTPRLRRVSSRTRCFIRTLALGAIRRFGFQSQVKLKPRNFRSCGLATALFSLFTFSLSFCTMKRVTLSITRCPARALRT
jgi:hypothetical protein